MKDKQRIGISSSSQQFYVNEQRIPMQAYEISGSNYVKLRDVGQAVNFGVTYDAAANTVTISPDKSYKSEVTTPAISRNCPERQSEDAGMGPRGYTST